MHSPAQEYLAVTSGSIHQTKGFSAAGLNGLQPFLPPDSSPIGIFPFNRNYTSLNCELPPSRKYSIGLSIQRINSTIHKAAGSLVIGHSPNSASRNAPRTYSSQWLPFTAYGTFFSGTMEQWNCTSQIMEQPGSREASSFVNSTVTALFTKLPASWFYGCSMI